jgi:hypothetical protein
MQFYICVSIILVSTLLFHTHTEAYQGLKLVPANANYPGKCYDEDTKAAYSVGENWKIPGKCEQYTCQTGPDNGLVIQFTGCGVVAAEPPCRVVRGNSADPYPDCCKKIVCN